MAVLLGARDVAVRSPLAHRADVLERLVAFGIPLRTLELLLPGWTTNVRAAPGPADPAQ